MIQQAKEKYKDIKWVLADATGDLSSLGTFDIVFSNAAIQWMPNHPALIKNMFKLLNKGGVLAVQVPYTEEMPIHTDLQKLITRPKWRDYFVGLRAGYSTHEPSYYYDILSDLSQDINLWVTNYHHVMEDHRALVKWYSGSGLRPYLDSIYDEEERADFCKEYEELLQASYPLQKSGKPLFPFTRIFFMALK